MPLDVLVVLGLLVAAVVLFATERISFDLTALLVLSVLVTSRILTPEEGFSGFSNPATITIAAMFVLSEGLHQTGLLERASEAFSRWGGGSYHRTLLVVMAAVAVISAFINNTAAVAIFIPVMITLSGELGVSASKLLMPLSFASMVGGVCTLIGTSTNILVSSLATEHGLEPFGMFEFAPVGLVFLGVGFAYLLSVGHRLVPGRREAKDLTRQFEMNAYLTDVVVEPSCALVGHPLEEGRLAAGSDLDVVQVIKRQGDPTAQPSRTVLEPGDVLRIRGSAREIDLLLERQDLSLKPPKEWLDLDWERTPDTLVEAVVAPESGLEAKPIGEVDLYERFGAVLLAIRHHGELQQEELGAVRLSGGDSVLLSMERDRIPELETDPSFVLVSRLGLPRYRTSRQPVALAILAAVVGTAAFGLAPIAVSATAGAALLLLTGCLSTDRAYRAINWKVIFLLAGVLPLGLAMERTGAAQLLSELLLSAVGSLGETATLSVLFLLSMLLTNVISNQATAVLLAPIALEAAASLGVSPRPLLVAVTFAASLSFLTPVGYQTNTLIYGPGRYRFTDFTRVGLPLNLLFWLLATLLIPVFWAL